ncbi:MAG TPA: enolase C-terminal domain-like protein [Solirubrobacteraceae bacterium]|nr:enolase C-terminal domain-like protein [Solirubrobacteraceae bacterium]
MTAPQWPRIEDVCTSAYAVPTATPFEQDGTLTWDRTEIVVVEVHAGGHVGLGYTYASSAAATVIEATLAEIIRSGEVSQPQRTWARMQVASRQLGHSGLAAMAISAVDIALWDLKARVLELSLADLLGRFRPAVAIYGSGGFCNLTEDELAAQVADWREVGARHMKIKVGADPGQDPARVEQLRELAGSEVELMVDANGAYDVPAALAHAETFARLGVSYLEEPLSSQNVSGLAAVAARAPAGMAVAAGEYAWNLTTLEHLLDAGAVHILQADVTRCGGITNMLRIDGLCRGHEIPFSAHCAPAVSAHACAAMESARNIEYFVDHARIEQLLFNGTISPEDGALSPDPGRPGHGLSLDQARAQPHAVA